MHAGQSSARKRREAIKRREDQEFAQAIDAMIWDQYVQAGSPTPAWVRPAIVVGGIVVAAIWAAAVAHGCS